jgi:hypothetical protein
VTELANALRAGGYRRENVVLRTQTAGADATQLFPNARNIREQLKLLLADRRPGDTVLVALAGHSVQFRWDDTSHCCPVDARLNDRSTLVSLAEVYGELEACRAGLKLLLADCCRKDAPSWIRPTRTVSLKLLADCCRNDPLAPGSRSAPPNPESATRADGQESPGGVLAYRELGGPGPGDSWRGRSANRRPAGTARTSSGSPPWTRPTRLPTSPTCSTPPWRRPRQTRSASMRQ